MQIDGEPLNASWTFPADHVLVGEAAVVMDQLASARPERPRGGEARVAAVRHALMTAIQERIAVAVVVFNNEALGWVLRGMGERAVAANFAPFDHAAIARSLGCEGLRVGRVDHLYGGLTEATKCTVPFVLDVPTSLKTSFKDVAQPLASTRWRGGD